MLSLSIEQNFPGFQQVKVLWDPNDTAMEVGTDPNLANFTLEVDGVPRAITAITWFTGTELLVNSAGLAAVTSFELTQDTSDPNVQNTNGFLALVPQNVFVAV